MEEKMKRVLIFITVICLFSAYVSANKFFITVSGNYFSSADSDYKSNYGNPKYYPEAKLAIKFKNNFYFWGSAGYVSAKYGWVEWSNKGVPEADIDVERKSNKLILSAGVGFYAGYLEPGDFALKLEAGVVSIANTVKTTYNSKTTNSLVNETETKEKGLGFRFDLGITYGLAKNIFSEFSLGYLHSTDKIDDDTRVKLGGFRASLGLGLTF
jgi:hypothetical protein